MIRLRGWRSRHRNSIPARSKWLTFSPKRVWGPPILLFSRSPGVLFQEVKWLGHRSSISRAEIMNTHSYASTTPVYRHGVFTGRFLPIIWNNLFKYFVWNITSKKYSRQAPRFHKWDCYDRVMTVKPIMFIHKEMPLIYCKIENHESSRIRYKPAVHEIKPTAWRPNDTCTTNHYIQNLGKTSNYSLKLEFQQRNHYIWSGGKDDSYFQQK